METLYGKNIVYRDLKPENVMLDDEGHIKLIDFGFAKKLSSKNGYRTTTNCGTVGYTAPELLISAESGYSFSVDIWGWAVLMVEILTG